MDGEEACNYRMCVFIAGSTATAEEDKSRTVIQIQISGVTRRRMVPLSKGT